MRLDIRYTTRFVYDEPVSESQNELRACPASDERQALLHYAVTTTPSSRVASYTDHWGTRVDTFGARLPHRLLEVVAQATVETAAQPLVTVAPRRADLVDPEFRDHHLEFLEPSNHVAAGPEVTAAAQQAADLAGEDVVSAVLAIHRAVGGRLTYAPGETYVGVPVDDVFAAGQGVCQDFAHLAIAMYRSVGIPARYVSGYLFTADDATGAEVIGDEVEVQTHAWVEVALPTGGQARGGRNATWMALDPTNQQQVGEQHVTIGRGRDYDDVAPFRGVFAGSSEHELEVSVAMRRLAVEPLDAPSGLTVARQRQAQQQ
ncbi:transglutaminase family protein [Nitriliruptor alkaliphilus]|uniref:transglutaminase family protein n=1 Tax=Nitriliruptor alkaliphilus TaxID=427918 RepID=UPI0006974DB7|nr:transglutaminase family protein [Nitriliruptor alkaliphilus]